MAKESPQEEGREEKNETPAMEARSHSPAFLKKAARLGSKKGERKSGRK